jgi:hypothetical protein
MMTDTHTQLEQDLVESTEPTTATDQIAPSATAEETVEAATVEPIGANGTGEPTAATADVTSESALEIEATPSETAAQPAVAEADSTEAPERAESAVAEVVAPAETVAEATEPAAEQTLESEAQPEMPEVSAQAEATPDAVPVEIDEASPEALAAPVATEPTAAEEPQPAEDDSTRLAKLEERVTALVEEVKAAATRATFLGRVRRLAGQIPEELGEQAAALRAKLGELEQEILQQIEERAKLKEAIVVQAEALAGSNEWKATGEAMRGLFDKWKAIGSAGHEAEDALWQRFQAARDTFSQRRNEWFEGRQKEWAANREKKEALCVRAEELSDSTEWRPTADAMRGLMAEWKTIGSAGRESDDALWSRFRAAQQIFFDRRSATYDENKRRKEELCAQAEAVKDSTDWRATADTLKGLQAAWKEIGPVGSRETEDLLWNRFRAATQAFFDRRGSSFAERDKDEVDNLRRKEELCVAAEALAVAADPVAATEEAKALQAEWKTIGPVRRDRGDALWARFRGACDRIFENAVNERARRQVAWSSKMREALERKEEQLARLEEAISHDEATVQRWQASLATRPDESTQAKIADTTARIAEKRTRAADLKASIDDIRVKMKG